MVKIRSIEIHPPLINTACAWSSDKVQLQALYDCIHTGAVTTRTATLEGFRENETHKVAFVADEKHLSTLNSYGYSPHPLSVYLQWIEEILSSPNAEIDNAKPFIISITTSDPSALLNMIAAIQALRFKSDGTPSALAHRLAIELNTSCPNIASAPPPAYHPSVPPLTELLVVLREEYKKDTTLTMGLKLPPYFYEGQFHELLKAVASLSFDANGIRTNPIAFFTCTNTLGNSLLFTSQTTSSDSHEGDVASLALPTPLGGLAGYCLHPLALGNIHTFSQLLKSPQYAELESIVLIGVGGVTDAQAAKRMRNAGASVVGAATLFGKYGVHAFEKLVV